MSAEIKSITDVSAVTPERIDFNYEEIKAYLSAALEKYRGFVVTPGSVREAKEIKARINKTAKQIDEYRLSVKKLYCAPLSDFEKKCKELVSMCAAVSDAIAEQTKAYDEDKRAAKLARLKDYFYEQANERGMTKNLDDLFALIQKNAWGNVTYAEETAMAEIEAFLSGGAQTAKPADDDIVMLLIRAHKRDVAAIKAFLAERNAVCEEQA